MGPSGNDDGEESGDGFVDGKTDGDIKCDDGDLKEVINVAMALEPLKAK